MAECEECKDKVEGNYVAFVLGIDGESWVFCSRECLNRWIGDRLIMTSGGVLDDEARYAYEERKGEEKRGK